MSAMRRIGFEMYETDDMLAELAVRGYVNMAALADLPMYDHGGLRFDPTLGFAHWRGERLSLSRWETLVMIVLTSRWPRDASTDQIVWGIQGKQRELARASARVALSALQQKLPGLIRPGNTKNNFGRYRLLLGDEPGVTDAALLVQQIAALMTRLEVVTAKIGEVRR